LGLKAIFDLGVEGFGFGLSIGLGITSIALVTLTEVAFARLVSLSA